jgi:arabinose-5-phosphate isomerase
MLQNGDIVIIISKSGETEEVIRLLPWVKRMGMTTIVMTGDRGSTIAGQGDIVIDIDVDEACPFNMIPTSSTTATLAIGDALAVALVEKRNFRIEDFALLHPGGAIGKRIFLKVEDLMHTGDAFPYVYEDMPMKDAIIEITTKRLGVTGVFNRKDELVGVITDGDLRRAIERYHNIMEKRVSDVMTANPKRITRDALAAVALKRMEEFSITSLFVVEEERDRRPVGIIHIHDILKAKAV